MPHLLVRSFAPFLLAFQPCFTQPSFPPSWALTCAWILCSGRRSLTRIIPELNHLQGQFGAGAILLGRSLAGLLALQFARFAGSALVSLAFAIHAYQDGEGP